MLPRSCCFSPSDDAAFVSGTGITVDGGRSVSLTTMHPVLDDLITLLKLERIEDNIFRGDSRDIGSAQVFGGQVLGQALSAAQHTVDGRVAHSLHAYFLRRGDMNAPIIYDVDRARDGGSFSNRRVVAIQHGRPILNLAASFQIPEEGCEHQADMPEVPAPDGLPGHARDRGRGQLEKMPEKMRRFMTDKRPFEFRPVDPLDLARTACRRSTSGCVRSTRYRRTRRCTRTCSPTCLTTNCLASRRCRTTCRLREGAVIMASLDHALWFHRPVRIDEWLLYSMDSPNASGARGFARGLFFNRNGELIASSAQEGLMRVATGARGKRSDPRLQT